MNKYIKVLIAVIGVLIAGYCFLFGQAFRQDEPHLAILESLPRALFGVAQVNENLYIAKNEDFDDFIKLMEKEGFIYREQLGATYFFMKGETTYSSDSRQYSAYFRLFTYPH